MPETKSDEFRTTTWLGNAMARAAGVKKFGCDPFCSVGFSGIPAHLRITRSQNAFKTDFAHVQTIGFNVPFSIPGRCLERLVEHAPHATMVGIVRTDTSVGWWRDYVLTEFEEVAFFHRVKFVNPDGTPSEGAPRYGISVIGRNVDRDVFRSALQAKPQGVEGWEKPWCVST